MSHFAAEIFIDGSGVDWIYLGTGQSLVDDFGPIDRTVISRCVAVRVWNHRVRAVSGIFSVQWNVVEEYDRETGRPISTGLKIDGVEPAEERWLQARLLSPVCTQWTPIGGRHAVLMVPRIPSGCETQIEFRLFPMAWARGCRQTLAVNEMRLIFDVTWEERSDDG